MNNKLLQREVINYINLDEDFFNCYVDALQKEISKTKSIVTDIVFDYINNWEDRKHLLKCYQNFVTRFIEWLFNDTNEQTQKKLIEYYFMEYEIVVKTIGTSWVKLSGKYINLDDLYDDFKLECHG
jgi:hypothetical protein